MPDEYGDLSPVFYVDKENEALPKAVNQQIRTMQSDGAIEAIIQKDPLD